MDLENLETRLDSEQKQTITSEQVEEKKLEDLPRLEEMMRTERQVKTAQTQQIQAKTIEKPLMQDRVFARKVDEKKDLIKKRLKIVTVVYTSVLCLLLAFVGINVANLIVSNKTITKNTTTITEKSQQLKELQQVHTDPADPNPVVEIQLNEPRDYSDDKKELTFFDKLTILFKNLFG
ncbi:MAG: hypothetical protein ACI4L6_01875 [Candidatus Onthoplasma sp.]